MHWLSRLLLGHIRHSTNTPRTQLRLRNPTIIYRMATTGAFSVALTAPKTDPHASPEDVDALVGAGHVTDDGLIETAGAQQCGVDEVGARGCGQYVNTAEALSTVHLREQLVDDTVRHTGGVMAALGRNGIEFVEKENARACGFGALEEISDRLFGCADVLVENLGAFDGDEVEAAFTGYG